MILISLMSDIQSFHKRSKHIQKIRMYKESECRQIMHVKMEERL